MGGKPPLPTLDEDQPLTLTSANGEGSAQAGVARMPVSADRTLAQVILCLALITLNIWVGSIVIDSKAATQTRQQVADRFVQSLRIASGALKDRTRRLERGRLEANSQELQPMERFPLKGDIAGSAFGRVQGSQLLQTMREFQQTLIRTTIGRVDSASAAAQDEQASVPMPLPDSQKLASLCCEYDAQFVPVNESDLMAPGLIGLGTHKAGTTWLWSILRESPYLNDADGDKELYFLAQYPVPPDAFGQYLARWPAQAPSSKAPDYINFEWTATYLHHPISACRIRRALPNTKFVVTFRDPVDRAISHYNMYLDRAAQGLGKLRDLTFLELIQKESRRMAETGCTYLDAEGGLGFSDCLRCQHLQPAWVGGHGAGGQELEDVCKDLNMQHDAAFLGTPCFKDLVSMRLLQFGIYHAPLRTWLGIFPPDRFLILSSVEVETDPVSAVNRVHQLLGKPPDFSREQLVSAKKQSNSVVNQFDESDPDWAAVGDFLRRFYAPYVAQFYELMDELGVDFPPFKRWPRGYDVAKVAAGDFTELVED